METEVKCIEVCTPDGKVLFSLRLFNKVARSNNSSPSSSRPNRNNGSTANSNGSDDLISEAQLRYLFRLLAEQDMDNEQAHQCLKDCFGVENLKEASKSEASGMIEKLIEKNAVKNR